MSIPNKIHFILPRQRYAPPVYERITDWVEREEGYLVHVWTTWENMPRMLSDFRNRLIDRSMIMPMPPLEPFSGPDDNILEDTDSAGIGRPPPVGTFRTQFIENGTLIDVMGDKRFSLALCFYDRLIGESEKKLSQDELGAWKNTAAASNIIRLWVLRYAGGIVFDHTVVHPGKCLPLDLEPPTQILFRMVAGDPPLPSNLILAAPPQSHKVQQICEIQSGTYNIEYEQEPRELTPVGEARMRFLTEKRAKLRTMSRKPFGWFKRRLVNKILKAQSDRSIEKTPSLVLLHWLECHEDLISKISARYQGGNREVPYVQPLGSEITSYSPESIDFEEEAEHRYITDTSQIRAELSAEYLLYSFEEYANYPLEFTHETSIPTKDDENSDYDFELI